MARHLFHQLPLHFKIALLFNLQPRARIRISLTVAKLLFLSLLISPPSSQMRLSRPKVCQTNDWFPAMSHEVAGVISKGVDTVWIPVEVDPILEKHLRQQLLNIVSDYVLLLI